MCLMFQKQELAFRMAALQIVFAHTHKPGGRACLKCTGALAILRDAQGLKARWACRMLC